MLYNIIKINDLQFLKMKMQREKNSKNQFVQRGLKKLIEEKKSGYNRGEQKAMS